MPDSPAEPLGPLEYLIARSRTLSQTALGIVRTPPRPGRPGACGEPSPFQMSLPDRYREIRASLERGFGAAPPSIVMEEARTQLSVALASLPSGQRRRYARWPLVRPCLLILDGVEIPASTLDIGMGGVMLAPLPGLAPGESLTALLELAPGDRCGARVTIGRDGVGHLALERPSGDIITRLGSWLETCAVSYEAALWEAAAMANAVETLFESALRAEIVTVPDLLSSTAYGPDALALFDDALTPLLAQAIPADETLAYVGAVDRQGYVAAESTADRADPTQFPSRRRRHVRDAVTLKAARFTASPVVQTSRRLPGCEPAGVVSDVSAPVVVRGRRWGCVQIGRNLVSSLEG